MLYATSIGWPTTEKLTIRSLAKTPNSTSKIAAVSLLGHRGTLEWSQDEKGLTITLPSEKPCDYAFAFKITGTNLRDFKPELLAAVNAITPGADGKCDDLKPWTHNATATRSR